MLALLLLLVFLLCSSFVLHPVILDREISIVNRSLLLNCSITIIVLCYDFYTTPPDYDSNNQQSITHQRAKKRRARTRNHGNVLCGTSRQEKKADLNNYYLYCYLYYYYDYYCCGASLLSSLQQYKPMTYVCIRHQNTTMRARIRRSYDRTEAVLRAFTALHVRCERTRLIIRVCAYMTIFTVGASAPTKSHFPSHNCLSRIIFRRVPFAFPFVFCVTAKKNDAFFSLYY